MVLSQSFFDVLTGMPKTQGVLKAHPPPTCILNKYKYSSCLYDQSRYFCASGSTVNGFGGGVPKTLTPTLYWELSNVQGIDERMGIAQNIVV